MTIIIAAGSSGMGKTTVTLTLLSFLSRKNSQVQSFKVGPDYIDPMFHSTVTGHPCRNLDPILTSENYVKSCFIRHTHSTEYALVEGVMGLFDGVLFNELKDFASTAHLARLLDIPVLLVIDCSRLSGSVAAIVHGYTTFDPKLKFAGLVLNRVGSDRHLELLQDALESSNLPILGVLHRQENITIPDRHLGLIPTGELRELETIFERLADLARKCFDWEKLLPLLKAENKKTPETELVIPNNSSIKIGVARDKAFNFYYQDNLDILQEMGAELIFWSPLEDEKLPPGIQGLYFGGGFPEVFAAELAANQNVLKAVNSAIKKGIPTYAECGGLMYLCEQIIDFENQAWEMVGIFPKTTMMGKHLTLGYRQATVTQDSPLLSTGETIWGHEFHRSQLTTQPINPLWQIRGTKKQNSMSSEGMIDFQVHASYIHLHFGEYACIPQRFLALSHRFTA